MRLRSAITTWHTCKFSGRRTRPGSSRTPLGQKPLPAEAIQIARGKELFSNKVSAGGAGCADCHHNGNVFSNGVLDDTFQDYNIHEPGVISESTVDGKGPFYRPENDYFFTEFEPPQDVGTPQNFSSRNTKHLRAIWDAVPRYLHYGFAHTLREVLLVPDSPLLQPGERGFNFRTVRTDQNRATATDFLGGPAVVLPTQVPITVADSSGALAGDGMGAIQVSLDSPSLKLADGTFQIDRLGTSNLAPLIVGGQDQPGAGDKPHPGDQRHTRQDFTLERDRHRRAHRLPQVARKIPLIPNEQKTLMSAPLAGEPVGGAKCL